MIEFFCINHLGFFYIIKEKIEEYIQKYFCYFFYLIFYYYFFYNIVKIVNGQRQVKNYWKFYSMLHHGNIQSK